MHARKHPTNQADTPLTPPKHIIYAPSALYRGWCRTSFRPPSLKALRQPLKVGLAVLLASMVVLVNDAHLGLQVGGAGIYRSGWFVGIGRR